MSCENSILIDLSRNRAIAFQVYGSDVTKELPWGLLAFSSALLFPSFSFFFYFGPQITTFPSSLLSKMNGRPTM